MLSILTRHRVNSNPLRLEFYLTTWSRRSFRTNLYLYRYCNGLERNQKKPGTGSFKNKVLKKWLPLTP